MPSNVRQRTDGAERGQHHGQVDILVLVIGDERADIAIVRESLADTSAGSSQIAYAGSLAEGVQRLAEGGIDIVLLDLSLPDSDGDITLARVRAVDPEVPILVIAGTHREEGLPVGALAEHQFILKDHVECHRLGDIIRTVIRKARGGQGQAADASVSLAGETTVK